jgi:hypothetical protein
MSPLEKAILETVVYFDIYNYPLRAAEIYRWIWKNAAALEEVINALENSELLKEKLSFCDGFFFLKGRGEIIKERLKRYRFAEKKFKKAKKVAWFFARLPGILGIAVCNDLGYGNSPEDGDIDLFIITKKNRLWTVRFLVSLFLKIFRLRPGEAKENAICPSFFVDEEHLNLKEFSAINPAEDDIHFIYWINQMTPIFSNLAEVNAKAGGIRDIWQKFYGENAWTENSLPNRRLFLTNPIRKVKSAFKFPLLLGNALENALRFKFLTPKIREIMNKSNDVVIRDGILKLHTNDRRKEYHDEFYNRISKLNAYGQ